MERLKQLVRALSKAPFSKALSLALLDSLTADDYVQLLSDVLCALRRGRPEDVRRQRPEIRALKIMQDLAIVRYSSMGDAVSQNDLLKSLETGDRNAIISILHWIVDHKDECEKRMYLAKYLIRINVPPEILQDPEVEQLHQQCETLMNEFKAVHRRYESAKADAESSDVVRRDIETMEKEKEQLLRRIAKVKKKAMALSGSDGEVALKLAKQLRLEVEQSEHLKEYRQEQRKQLLYVNQKLQRLQQKLDEASKQEKCRNPEELIAGLREEIEVLQYVLNEKLPAERDSLDKSVQQIKEILAQPSMQQEDLDALRSRVGEKEQEIQNLEARKKSEENETDTKLAVFRQQADIIRKQKEAAFETLEKLQQQLEAAKKDLDEKKRQITSENGQQVITSANYKSYANMMRAKSHECRKKKAHLNDLNTELVVLDRTEQILLRDAENLGFVTKSKESDEGNSVDEVVMMMPMEVLKGNEEAVKAATAKLDEKLAVKKQNLHRILEELGTWRDKSDELAEKQDKAKRQQQAFGADASLQSLQEEIDKLSREVERSRKEVEELRAKQNAAKGKMALIEGRGETSVDSYLLELKRKVEELRGRNGKLRANRKAQREKQAYLNRQIQIYRDTVKLMECKIQSLGYKD